MGSIDTCLSLNEISVDAQGGTFRSIQTHALSELFSENVTAKILRTATDSLVNNNPPARYPHIVPQKGHDGRYEHKEIDFWTCGFFPGCIYSLLERAIKYPNSLRTSTENGQNLGKVRQRLEILGRIWSDPIHGEAHLTNTHDLGFIILPHMRPRWEIFHDQAALDTIITAAQSLYTRFNAKVGAIRSWDEIVWQKDLPHITGMEQNFIVIIDSLCNLELLFYAAAQSGLTHLAGAAITHAKTLATTHLRAEPSKYRRGFDGMLYSSVHVVNFSPCTGEIKERRTVQGYKTTSTWSRGQAWAIIGYAQVYTWTLDAQFLDIACGLAEYFLLRLEEAPSCVEVELDDGSGRKVGRYVPVWDFDAPIEDERSPLRDTSAGTAAANGMLILAQALTGQGRHELSARFLYAATHMMQDIISYSLADEKAMLRNGLDGKLTGTNAVPGQTFEAILKNATVSNNDNNYVKIRDHGLVYADYFFIEFGTRLLRFGMV
ncbi:Six-hairpin glycosidase-like protein [Dactylonectria macrodidyma]|uniref:Six-hairpin glycosidase-like protein n=1 Tax=Dactylonectria macrodidyma TaxID=307937 RepID=A0A9P9ERQ8_9HYPO|nr:Six-hairpin glycosidase-like protein [Dactylonectria macrodidyma]